jgi:hypothetical protein
MARVPATDIEFPPHPNWQRDTLLSNGLTASLTLPGFRPVPGVSLRVGEPIVAAVTLQNRLGSDRTFPTGFVRKADGGKPALRRGISLEVRFTPLSPSGQNPHGSIVAWDELRPIRTARFDPDQAKATRTLGPAEAFEAFRVTLNDWVDLSRPGTYRVKLTFDDAAGVGKGSTNELYLPIGLEPDPGRL